MTLHHMAHVSAAAEETPVTKIDLPRVICKGATVSVSLGEGPPVEIDIHKETTIDGGKTTAHLSGSIKFGGKTYQVDLTRTKEGNWFYRQDSQGSIQNDLVNDS